MSSSSKIIFSVLFSLALLQTSMGANPLFNSCTSNDNFTVNSPYHSNLKTLINSLIYKTPSAGFGVASVGDQYQNQKSFGLALCRGDVSASECKTCVTEAAREILDRCRYQKGAIIWYDNCMLKYMGTDFFGKIDNTNSFSLLNVKNVSDPATFNYMSKELLSLLAYKASVDPKMYATGEIKIGGEANKIYGLTQCTRDLSSGDCKKCLDDAIKDLPNCCDGKEGGRVVGGSCNVRYEIYPFFKH